jgi:drug/metabolite transporter (DMT)-like permease
VRAPVSGYAWVLAAAVLWGSLGIAVRFVTAAGVGVYEASVWRAGLAFLGSLAASGLRHRPHLAAGAADLALFAGYGLVSIALFFLAYFTAIQRTTVATAAVLLYTAPAWVTVLGAVLLGERLSRSKLATLALAFGGCTLVVRAYDPSALRADLAGVLAGLASGLTYGLYSIFGKVALRRHPPLVVLTYALGFGTLFLLAIGLAAGVPPHRFLPSAVAPAAAPLLYLGLVTTWLAQWLYVTGLRTVEASRASVVATVEPVVAGVLGYAVFGETLEPPQLVGAAAVLLAAALAQLRR